MTPRALIAEVCLRLLYPAVLVASLWVLLRGHNAPGGGFIGGLMAAAATAAYALIFNVERAQRRLPLAPLPLAATGVMLALLSGLPGWAQGWPYLTHLWWHIGSGAWSLPISTVILFDLGVYLCVWGAVSGYCLGLLGERESERW